MRLVVSHNFYQQPGGEDCVFADEVHLLEDFGHDVRRFTAHNNDVSQYSRLGLARATLHNHRVCAELGALIERQRTELVHFHNTFPLISPAAYAAARARGAAVVQTLHNFRLLCPSASFFRQGRVCEQCLGRRFAWPAIWHGCYRGSRSASAVVASMLAAHSALGTWTRDVDVYVALTEFARRKLIAGGLPARKIVVKPNFVSPDPGIGPGGGGYAIYVGRLSPEKGVPTLLEAWNKHGCDVPLVIVGDGPLADHVRAAARQNQAIRWLGARSREEVLHHVGEAELLVCPSACYEGFPKTIAEAFAKGTPVVAPRLGALAEIVDDGRVGLHFEPGNAVDLAEKVQRLASQPAVRQRLRGEARAEFEAKYTAKRNYGQLMHIYHTALQERAVGSRPKLSEGTACC